jgi:phenylalanyl-tRNA synthetase beta chain
VDDDGVEWASRRAVQLILELAGGAALRGAIEVGGPRPARPVARVRPARVSRVLGMEVPPARVRRILESLGCSVTEREGAFEVAAPPGRRDLRLEADYIEEVARVQGYDAVPCDTRLPQAVPVDPPEERIREVARATLAALGAYEVLTWSFAAAGEPNRVPFWTDGPLVPLRDPQGQVDRTLRASLAPGLLGVLETNESYKESLRPVFEIARIYRKEKEGYGEKTVLGVAAPGDPLGVKGLLERLFERLGIALELRPRDFPFLAPGASAEVVLGGKTIGYVGLAAPELSGLRSAAGVAEIDFEALVPAARPARPYREFNRRPPVERDLSVVLGDGVTWKEVEAVVREAAPATLERLRFLSEYRGKPIPPGHKGWAFSMLFRAADRTLTSEEADGAVQAVLRALESRLGARLR